MLFGQYYLFMLDSFIELFGCPLSRDVVMPSSIKTATDISFKTQTAFLENVGDIQIIDN